MGRHTKATSRTMRSTGWENASGQMAEATPESGNTGSSMEKEYKSLQMARPMKESMMKTKNMVMESSLGLMGENTMVDGYTVNSTEWVSM